jgi:hypothetical protein
MKNTILYLFLVLMFFVSCKKTEQNTNTSTTVELMKGISLINGYVCFKDTATFNGFVQKLQTQVGVEEWAKAKKANSFVSHEDLFQNMETKYAEMDTVKDSTVVRNFQKENSMIATFEKTGEVESNCPAPYDKWANKDQMYKVGDILIAALGDKMIYVAGGDEKLMQQAIHSKDGKDIDAKKVTIVPISKTISKSISRTCEGSMNTPITLAARMDMLKQNSRDNFHTWKVVTEWVLNNIPTGGTFSGNVDVTVKVKSYKRGFLGFWYSRKADKKITGNLILRNNGINYMPAFAPTSSSFTVPSPFVTGSSNNATYNYVMYTRGHYWHTNATEKIISPWQACDGRLEVVTTFDATHIVTQNFTH